MVNQEEADKLALRYLDLLKRCLTRALFDQSYVPLSPLRRPGLARIPGFVRLAPFVRAIAGQLGGTGLVVTKRTKLNMDKRSVGKDWPHDAETMVGLRRLDNLQVAISDVLANKVPGDLLEAGTWRGGAAIFMRGVLAAFDSNDRTVWVADSFRGLPRPEEDRYPADRGDKHWAYSDLAVSRAEVERNFERYGFLDERTQFLEGWFEDSLPGAPIQHLAVLRLDGDMYSSTIQALNALYHKVSVGGYVIIDDYGAIPACKQAVDEFRSQKGIDDEIVVIDWTGVYWKKSA